MYSVRHLMPIAGLSIAGALTACTSDHATVPGHVADETAQMCLSPKTIPSAADVPIGEVPAHRAKGEYVTHLFVDPATTRVGDSIHFKRITDAMAVVRAARQATGETTRGGCRIEVDVATGVFTGTTKPSHDPSLEQLPIVLDVPDVWLRGALDMVSDSAKRPTGEGTAAGATTIAPSPGLVTSPLPEVVFLVEGHPNGSAGNGVIIQGFDVRSGHVGVDSDTGGYGILSIRVNRLVVRGNKFEPTLTSAIDLRASQAAVDGNWISGGNACDVCLAGPGQYTAVNNKILQGGVDGIVLSATVILPLPSGVDQLDSTGTASVSADVENNEVRDHMRVPVGVGIRAMAVATGAPNMSQSTGITIRNNLLLHNMFGLLVEAGFPVVNTLLRGDINATLDNNVIQQSCQADLMVSFNRHATTIGAAQLTRPFLRNSTYQIMLNGNLAWSAVWYANPSGLGNTLIVDDQLVAAGSRLAYDPKKACP